MHEKRKNSDKNARISIFLASVLVLAGLFAGLNLGSRISDTEVATEVAIEEFQLRNVDLSGEWIGTTTQDYDLDSHYDYRIVIEQDGSQIAGMSYLDMIEDYEIYAEERIEGYIAGEELIYSEVETLLLENATFDQGCLTETTLTYQVVNGLETLVGNWEYVLGEDEDCEGITGRVILTRQSN